MRNVCFILLMLSSICAHARVDLSTTQRIVIPVDDVTPKITTQDVQKVITEDIATTSDSSNVLSRIADRGFSMWFNSPSIRETTLGTVAHKTEEKLKADLVVDQGQGDEKVQHKFSFKIEAFQALAKLEYTGWTKAAVNYDAKDASTDVSFKEKLFSNKNFVISHKGSKKEALSMVGLDWVF